MPIPEETGKYIDFLLQIIKKEEVEVILPQTTREIEVLSTKIDFLKNRSQSFGSESIGDFNCQ